MAKKEVDIFRDTPLRYVGYANEVGEAFRPIFPRFVVPSYGLAFLYVGADSISKTKYTYDRGSSMEVTVGTFVDVLVWQTLASVLIPGKVINMVTAFSTQAVSNSTLPRRYTHRARYLPTAVGLAFIPLIIKPIDHGVDLLMDSTLRKVVPHSLTNKEHN
jgi:fission process protein 1